MGADREREESERPTPGTKREKPVARLHLPDPSSGIGTPVRFQTGSNVEEAGLTIARHRAAFHSFAQFEFDRETRRFQHHRSFGSIRFGSVRFGSVRGPVRWTVPSFLFFSWKIQRREKDPGRRGRGARCKEQPSSIHPLVEAGGEPREREIGRGLGIEPPRSIEDSFRYFFLLSFPWRGAGRDWWWSWFF